VRSSRCIFEALVSKRFEVYPKFLSLESIGTSERFWKPKALWRRTFKKPKTHRTV